VYADPLVDVAFNLVGVIGKYAAVQRFEPAFANPVPFQKARRIVNLYTRACNMRNLRVNVQEAKGADSIIYNVYNQEQSRNALQVLAAFPTDGASAVRVYDFRGWSAHEDKRMYKHVPFAVHEAEVIINIF
jgi:hypothetical protein